MKNIFVFLFLQLMIMGCENDGKEAVPTEGIIRTENVKISYDENGIDNCIYLITTDKPEFFTTDNLTIELEHSGTYNAEMSFMTLNEIGHCGFGGPTQKIKVLSVTNISPL